MSRKRGIHEDERKTENGGKKDGKRGKEAGKG